MARPTFMRGGAYDGQLEDLIQASSWKQALSLCEKRIKKGDKSDEILVTKAYVLLLWPDPKRKEQGRKELDVVLERAPPVTDANVLSLVVQFDRYRRRPFNATIWERALKARPNDKELYRSWFLIAFAAKDWRVAQKASVTYKNAFPKQREAHYWYIVANHILSSLPGVAENERRMYAQLNYRTLAKAVSMVSTSGDASSTGLGLEKLEDLLLLVRVYRSQGKAKEALEILDDDRVGINSRIGNKAWELVRQRIDLLEQSEQWEGLWRYCHALLEDALTDVARDHVKPAHFAFGKVGDDWKVWSGLITAAGQISEEENAVLTAKLLESFGASSRNAQLALLKFYSSDMDEDVHYQKRLLTACNEHFEKYSSRLVCFYDLNPYVKYLDRSIQGELLQCSAQVARGIKPPRDEPEAVQWLTSEINVLKLDYFLVVSKHPNFNEKALLEAFVCNCLRLYKMSLALGSKLPLSERRPGDDAAILAVMAMFHMLKLGENNAVLRSVAVLEMVLANSRHNYDALLLQIRLALVLGTAPIAMGRYSQLCVKNMQHATLSWILFTRISTLHPYPLSGSSQGNGLFTIRDPSATLTSALEWHRSAQQVNDESISQMLSDGQNNMLFDALDLGQSIENGFSKFIAFVESSRIQRLGGASGELVYNDLISLWTGEVVDNRDAGAFPSCESSFQDPATRLLIDNKALNGRWLSTQLEMACFWDILHRRETMKANTVIDMVHRESGSSNNGTAIEDKQYSIVSMLKHLCSLAANADQPRTKQSKMLVLFDPLEAALADLRRALEGNASASEDTTADLGVGFTFPTWKYYHWHLTILDACQFYRATMMHLTFKNRDSNFVDSNFLANRIDRLQALIREIQSLTESNVSCQQASIRSETAKHKLVHAIRWGQHEEQDAVGKALESLIDQATMEMTVKDVCDSWTEAMDGILKAKNHEAIKL